MTSTSGPDRPLVISLSAPLRITSARDGEPEPRMAAVKPAAIDSTDTSTTTTPAMPTMATPDEAEPLRNGPQVERRDGKRLRDPAEHYVSGAPQRVGDLQLHALKRGHQAGEQAQPDDQRRPNSHVARRAG